MSGYEHIQQLAKKAGLQLSICAETYPVITEQLYRFYVDAYGEGESAMFKVALQQRRINQTPSIRRCGQGYRRRGSAA